MKKDMRENIEKLANKRFKNPNVIIYDGFICAEENYEGVKYVLFDPDRLINTDYRVVMYLAAVIKDDYYSGDYDMSKIFDHLYFIPNHVRVECRDESVNIFVHDTFKF